MAELKNMVMTLIAVLFIASSIVTIYSVALTNNLNNGGSGESVPFPLINQTQAYTQQMDTFSRQLANGTETASTQPQGGSIQGGIGAITTAGTGAVSLSFGALSILLAMIGSLGVTFSALGIPGIVAAFGIIAISVGIVFAILAAVFKWWI